MENQSLRRRSGLHSTGINVRAEVCRGTVYWSLVTAESTRVGNSVLTASLEREVLFFWLSEVPNVGWGANGMVWVREGILQWKWIHTAMKLGEDLYMTAWGGRVVSMSVTSESKVGWDIKSTDAFAVLVEGTSLEVITSAVKTKVLVEETERRVDKEKGGGESAHIGFGDSFWQKGGWKKKTAVLGGMVRSEIGDVVIIK